jgi:LAO/AO transport system kinase
LKKRLSKQAYLKGIIENNPTVISKAITLFESSLPQDADLTNELLQELYPHSGKSLRLGISGIPGAGKSTFIEGLGKYLTSLNQKVAVLTTDPSSTISKGSILGDKTRMESLATDPLALIRTSPSQTYLGGVTMHTRKLILLCEAAGYDMVMIETVGTGQSESDVKQMTDFLILLVLAGTGDELQGMKKGIAELADLFIVNKADGDNLASSMHAQQELQHVLSLSTLKDPELRPEVIVFSSLASDPFSSLWHTIENKLNYLKKSGFLDNQRKKQNIVWMNEAIKNQLLTSFYEHPLIKGSLGEMQRQVSEGKLSGIGAAEELIKIFKSNN